MALSLLILHDLCFDYLLASFAASIRVLVTSAAADAAATCLRLADDLDRLRQQLLKLPRRVGYVLTYRSSIAIVIA